MGSGASRDFGPEKARWRTEDRPAANHKCPISSEMPYRAIKTNIAESLNIILQIERRPGMRFVSEVLEIRGYEPEADRYDLYQVYGQSLGKCGP